MEKFFKKIKKLEHKHQHELSMLCGAAAMLLLVAGFIATGAPSRVYAWIIYVYPTYTPVVVGGYTTISWTGSPANADYCIISPTTVNNISGQTCNSYTTGTDYGGGSCDSYGGNCTPDTIGPPYTTTTYCSLRVNGANGSAVVGPVNFTNGYRIDCTNVSGGWGSSSGSGGTNIAVVPTAPVYTPSTFVSFTADSNTISPGSSTNLHWVYTPGNNFYGCEIQGGNWPSGYFWLPATDTGVNNNTGTLNNDTTYQINCYDSNNGWGAWHPLTITTTGSTLPPPTGGGTCTDIPSATTVPSGCVVPSSTPGICTPSGGLYSADTNTCSCPVGEHVSGTACVPNTAAACSNGLNNSYAPSCACPPGQYQPIGASSCVALPVCANGLNSSYSPSCMCPSGQEQVLGGSTCTNPGVINSLTANPSRVLKGNTTTISWSTSNMNTCALSGFSAAGTAALSTVLSSSLQQTVESKTIYTLSCTDMAGVSYSSSVTLNLIPITIEQ